MKLTKKTVWGALKNPVSPWQTIALTFVAALAYLFRAHPYFFKPQLFAEDGIVWLSEGQYKGAKVLLLKPYAGFFHFPERLFGFLVARLPLYWAPALFAWAAWGLFIAMTYYLLSVRTKLLTSNFERIFMVLALGLIANFKEFFFNFSNSAFIMGIIGILILVAKPSRHKLVGWVEKIFFVLACMCLPFSWVYLPITVIDRLKYKTKNTFFLLASALTAVGQAIAYITSHSSRSPVTLVSLFSKFTLLEIYNQIIIPAVRFARIDLPVGIYDTSHYLVAIVALSIAGLLAMGYIVLRKANRPLWLVMIFLAGMTFASIKSPTLSVKLPIDALKIMSVEPGGNRYFIFGIVAVYLLYIKAAYQIIVKRYQYILLAAFMAFGVLTSLHYKSFYPDKGWSDYSAAYGHGVDLYYQGQKAVSIPVNPTPWSMGLVHPGK